MVHKRSNTSVLPGEYLPVPACSDKVVRDALTYLHHACLSKDDLSVKGLAKRVGVSRSLFSRRFKDAVGQTPVEYIDMLRLHKARTLLAQPKADFAAVAKACGYESHHGLWKLFRRTTSQPPGAFSSDYKENRNGRATESVREDWLDYTKQQLTETRRAIKEISTDCGFIGEDALYGRFVRAMKLSPQAYRKKFWADDSQETDWQPS